MATHERYMTTELDLTQHVRSEWEVDVPVDTRSDPATYLMQRRNYANGVWGKWVQMNSPMLRQGKKKPRELAERAVAEFIRTGNDVYSHEGKPRVKVHNPVAVTRVRNKQRAKTMQPLIPVALEQKSDGALHLELISDCDEPTRYAVVIPRATAGDTDTYVCQLYRRTNP